MIINNFDIVKSFQNSLQFIYSYLSFWCYLNQQFWHRPQPIFNSLLFQQLQNYSI